MDQSEKEEPNEVSKKCKSKINMVSLVSLNLADTQFTTTSGKHLEQPLDSNQKEEFEELSKYENNNNHHVVPVGVVIVLITIYLGLTSVQKCLVSCVENPQITDSMLQKEEFLNYLHKPEIIGNSQILERLLEYKDICKDLEIFTKDIHQEQAEEEEDNNLNGILEDIEVASDSEQNGGGIEDSGSGSASGASINGNCARETIIKYKKSKYSIKTTNAKNGFNKYNKSTKAKYQKNQKKELNLNKKNSTAEPIIYLFALVFVYLLLKAASDINQHYKSQNKNDKRLRRCSLQSYAQTHRPDRRASKGISAKSLPKF